MNSQIQQQEIEKGFRELGLKKGDIVEVHSSLTSFGHVQGGAKTVVDALIEVVGKEGTIAMSAYPVSPPIPLTDEEKIKGIQWKVKILPDGSNEKTGLGAIVEEFIRTPSIQCGSGLYRVCALGKNADIISQGYKHLIDRNGFVLLMGGGIDRASSMHIAEDVPIPEEISNLTKIPEDIAKDYDLRKWSIGYGKTPEDAWEKVYKKADQMGFIKHANIGNAACHLFRAKDIVDIFVQWRSNNPYDLYGVVRPNS